VKQSFVALLGAALLCSATTAHADWRRFETAHFIIYSQSDDERVEKLATGLESTDGLMRMATGLPMDEKAVKVRIYEMADEGQVQSALGESNTGIAGFYTSNILGPYAVTLRKAYSAEGDFTAEIVLHHEYAHHFMMQYFPATYPTWYVEGFAELIGASKTLPDGRIAYGFPAKYRGDEIAFDWVDIRDVLLRPAEKVVNFDLYGQGWAMTHYLTFSKERAGQLRKYLEALNAGKSAEEAASAFGDLGELNREAHAYLSKGQFNYTPVSVPIHQPVIEKVSPVGPAEAALISETIAFNDDDLSLYRKASERDRERKRREGVLEHIRADAARFPTDPYALYLLALAEDSSGNVDAASADVDRLLQVQPQHTGGMVLKSMLLSEEAMKSSGQARLDEAQQARRLAMAANQADADNPLAYVAFYEGFRATGSPVPANAVEGLEAAVEKLPNNTRIRQLLVDEFASEHQWGAAMAVLAPLANSPHESPLRQAAQEEMAKLQAQAAQEKAGN
jgi:tetratricopeptide (TPR) repeat protein